MNFSEQPVGVRRGQTLQLRLTLGDNTGALLIPNGSFYQETGGNWVFVGLGGWHGSGQTSGQAGPSKYRFH